MKKLFLLMLISGSAMADNGALLKCGAVADNSARLACYDALAAAARSAPAAAPAPVAAAPTRMAQEQAFGLAEKKAPLASIESTIPGSFDGWGPGQLITLANGQVWRVSDDTTGVVYGKDLKVSLERNSFGNTFMVIQGTTKAPKVKRIQ